MAEPTTTGMLRANINEMQIGDFVKISAITPFTQWAVNQGTTELPYGGVGSVVNGHFSYFVKVDKGLLISDRIWWVATWGELLSYRVIDGIDVDFGDGINPLGLMRSMTGGVAHIDQDGNKSLTHTGLGGWPSNEYDKYIVNFSTELIKEGNTLDGVFHWEEGVSTWCKETPALGVLGADGSSTNNTYRTRRGKQTGITEPTVNRMGFSNVNTTGVGFRPVFEYKEV